MTVPTTITPAALRLTRSKWCGPGCGAICCRWRPIYWPIKCEALLDCDEAKAEQLTHAFQDKAANAIEALFEAGAADARLYRRTLGQIGRPRASEDATTMKCVLAARDELATLAARLPLRIVNFAGDQLDECQALIEETAAQDRCSTRCCS